MIVISKVAANVALYMFSACFFILAANAFYVGNYIDVVLFTALSGFVLPACLRAVWGFVFRERKGSDKVITSLRSEPNLGTVNIRLNARDALSKIKKEVAKIGKKSPRKKAPTKTKPKKRAKK